MERAINDEPLFDEDSPPIARSHENISIAGLFRHLAQDRRHVRSRVCFDVLIHSHDLRPLLRRRIAHKPARRQSRRQRRQRPTAVAINDPPPSVEGGAAAARSRRRPPLPIQEARGDTPTNGIFVPCHGGVGRRIRDPTPVVVVGEEDSRDASSSSSMASIGDRDFCLFPEDVRPPRSLSTPTPTPPCRPTPSPDRGVTSPANDTAADRLTTSEGRSGITSPPLPPPPPPFPPTPPHVRHRLTPVVDPAAAAATADIPRTRSGGIRPPLPPTPSATVAPTTQPHPSGPVPLRLESGPPQLFLDEPHPFRGPLFDQVVATGQFDPGGGRVDLDLEQATVGRFELAT